MLTVSGNARLLLDGQVAAEGECELRFSKSAGGAITRAEGTISADPQALGLLVIANKVLTLEIDDDGRWECKLANAQGRLLNLRVLED